MQTLQDRISRYLSNHELIEPGDRLGIAVSGGSDSVALFRLLLELRPELGVVLSVIHFNHQLRGTESDSDKKFVSELAREHNLEFFCAHGDVKKHSAALGLSIETAARRLRYEYFHELLRLGKVNRIATAHTLDDQAETVLLKLFRGAGTKGLAGIFPKLNLGNSSGGNSSIIRPLLGIQRRDLRLYLNGLQQDWREDTSNRDLRHARNVVRHGILPRLQRNINPSVREVLADTAELARAEEEYWTDQVDSVLPGISKNAGDLSIPCLRRLPLAMQRRIVRAAGQRLQIHLDFKHVEQILELGCADASLRTEKSLDLTGGWVVSKSKDLLRFSHPETGNREYLDYQYVLEIPGRVNVPEAGKLIEAIVIEQLTGSGYNPDHAFARELLAQPLKVRNWKPGDRFWPGHSKAARKVKELLQEKHLTGSERKLWPVVLSGDEVVWMSGFSSPSKLRPRNAWLGGGDSRDFVA